jgi:hypothetical protein
MEEILWVIFEIVFEIVGEVILEIGKALFGSLDASIGNALFDAFAWFAVGALLGLLSGVVLPDRLMPKPRRAGLSLIASPLACGFAMHNWGSSVRGRGRVPGSLATFHGGAAFALGAALGRFVLVA